MPDENHKSRDEIANVDSRPRERCPTTAPVPRTLSVQKRPKQNTATPTTSLILFQIIQSEDTRGDCGGHLPVYQHTTRKENSHALQEDRHGQQLHAEAEVDGKSLIKIGLTKKATYDRLNDIQSTRKPTQLSVKEPGLQKIVKTAEQLILRELGHFQHEFTCKTCRVEHVMERRTRFCASEPWYEHGELHPFWKRRLEHTMSASRFLSDHDHKSRAGVRKPFGKGHGDVQREEGGGSGALHLLPCSRARDAGDVAVFDGLDVGREGSLAPWRCAFETFVPAATFSRPTLPSPVPGDFAVRHVCLCHLGALARLQLWQMKVEDDDAGSRADEPRDKDEPKPDKQGEEIKPSTEAMSMESSDDGHDTSDDEPSRTGQLTRLPNSK
ncbi:hypothetical protein MANI_022282 [Metarhizium anisopliae]